MSHHAVDEIDTRSSSCLGSPYPPLGPSWVIVDGSPMFHRSSLHADAAADAMHVHGFGISGTYLEPTAALLAPTTAHSYPTYPGWDAASGPSQDSTYPGSQGR
jgi:hypothetical protein